MPITRRIFCTQAAGAVTTGILLPRPLIAQASTARPDVAVIDHDRILKAAQSYLTKRPTPLTTLPCKRSPGTPHDFYSEAEDYWPDPAKTDGSYLQRKESANPAAFTAHRNALLDLSIWVPALVAAYLLTKEERYAEAAVRHLRAWFVDPATSMTPSLMDASVVLPAKTGRFEGIVETVHLAEVAQAIPFLTNAEAFTKNDADGVTRWFGTYFDWLNNSQFAGLARDQKDHHGSSWLLQTIAFMRLRLALLPNTDDTPLGELRHRYKSVTIRAQINADGVFPHELSTPNAYRLSLFNLDMLAAICLLLYTPFDSVWEYDLQDGPGMRAAIARHFPFIRNKGAWPYPADATHFDDLPLRQPSLLFCARAYTRPEYADLWKMLPADTEIAELQRTFPIRQPLLWVTRPKP
ncbi:MULTISPECIES: alginate lyase family protein [Acidobacteriaceae]|uniref:alginate lyase family protein n=1 Tax=Acidobacteriaceae TaxID=204434 RepID=UPI00131DC8FA|nr:MULTISPECIES: alginate lyase family protein [Acidobacteriaceae]MDW5266664.1 alginate lyase family protein [Edaphobacter sp.]